MHHADLRQHRLALGLSVRALAQRTGLTTAAIEHLERHGDLPQRSPAHRVRDALGIPHTGNDNKPSPPTDDAAIEALIADRAAVCSAEYLADALAWKLPRAIAAIQALERRLQQTGQTLIQDSQHHYRLAARTSLTTHQARRRAHELHLAEPDGVTAAVLLQILKGPRDNRRWTNFRTPETRQAIRHLLAAGLIQDNGVTLTPAKPALDTFALDGGQDAAWTYRRVVLANAREIR